MLAGDVAGLDRLWAADLLINAPDNIIKTKDEVIQAVRASHIRYTSFKRTVERVAFHGDIAVTMGSEVVVPAGDGADGGKEIHRRYTNVWRNAGGDWRLIARHAHVVPARWRQPGQSR